MISDDSDESDSNKKKKKSKVTKSDKRFDSETEFLLFVWRINPKSFTDIILELIRYAQDTQMLTRVDINATINNIFKDKSNIYKFIVEAKRLLNLWSLYLSTYRNEVNIKLTACYTKKNIKCRAMREIESYERMISVAINDWTLFETIIKTLVDDPNLGEQLFFVFLNTAMHKSYKQKTSIIVDIQDTHLRQQLNIEKMDGFKLYTDNTENMDKTYNRRYKKILIHWYKNQEFRNEPKEIFIAPPICENKTCHCRILDYFQIYLIILQRRKALINKLKSDALYSTKQKTKTFKKRLSNLDTNANNYIFVGSNGAIWRPSKLSLILKELISTLKIADPQFYPSYCIRIGSTSLCHLQEIDLLKLIRFVVWSVKDLPHVSNRYINFSIKQLRILPFEMIHGRNRPGKMNVDKSKGKLKTYNLWEGKLCEELFS